MRNSPDPSVHREREKQLVEHVERLLSDPRLRVDTSGGHRPVVTLGRAVRKWDRAVDLKRLMSEVAIPDRELEAKMPVGLQLDVVLFRRRLLFLRRAVGGIRVVSLPPWRQLLEGETPQPVGLAELTAAVSLYASADAAAPVTVVFVATSGFTREAHELAERRANRTVILAEPNDAGGWTLTGPPETKSLVDLLDPEELEQKRARVRRHIAASRAELLAGGLSADRLAAATALPLHVVEEELKAHAQQSEGLVARRLEGRLVLFREGSVPAARSGGSEMPFMQRIKTLFARKDDTEKKLALLSERRATLALQRDRSYEEMSVLEKKEQELREQFKQNASPLTKRRITSQLLQLRKDLERRQQLLSVLNQQIDVVGTHLHNIELVRQGKVAELPNAEELANDAAAAEEVLAELQASTELAGSVAAVGTTGLSAEEQALYEELEREAAGGGAAPAAPQASAGPVRPQTSSGAREPAREATAPPPQRAPNRGEAEPG